MKTIAEIRTELAERGQFVRLWTLPMCPWVLIETIPLAGRPDDPAAPRA